jgi:hypothetical protein
MTPFSNYATMVFSRARAIGGGNVMAIDMQKFKYFFCSEDYLAAKGLTGHQNRVEAIAAALNLKGKEGWELVSVHISNGSPHYTFKQSDRS